MTTFSSAFYENFLFYDGVYVHTLSKCTDFGGEEGKRPGQPAYDKLLPATLHLQGNCFTAYFLHGSCSACWTGKLLISIFLGLFWDCFVILIITSILKKYVPIRVKKKFGGCRILESFWNCKCEVHTQVLGIDVHVFHNQLPIIGWVGESLVTYKRINNLKTYLSYNVHNFH